jgi:hypothetical protein
MCVTDCVSIGLLQGDSSRLQVQSRNFEFKTDDVFRGGGRGDCHVTIELNQSVSVFLIPVTRYHTSRSPSVCMEM